MPDKRKHRGPHPNDAKLFAPKWLDSLRTAVAHQSLLLTLGYAPTAALKLVGDRFRLTERQRRVVRAAACSDAQRNRRADRMATPDDLRGASVYLDGFNQLITLESALSGGFLFRGRDGVIRDLASVHGTYRRVAETDAALRLIGAYLAAQRVERAVFYLDQPVSNSGRLKTRMTELAAAGGWNWTVELHYDPDGELLRAPATTGIVCSADALVLDGAAAWFPLVDGILERHSLERLLDLRSRTDP